MSLDVSPKRARILGPVLGPGLGPGRGHGEGTPQADGDGSRKHLETRATFGRRRALPHGFRRRAAALGFPLSWRGKLREAGPGSAAKGGVSLKAAREKAAEGRALLAAGLDPIAEWNKPDPEEVPTFGKAADEYLAAHEGGFRNDKHKAQWR